MINQLLKENGTLYTIKYMKDVRLAITRYMCGFAIHKTNRVSLTRSGFPSRFLFLKEYIDSGVVSKIKFVLSLLTITKSIFPRKDEIIPVDYSSITDNYKGRQYFVPKFFILK
jgi:hypothetical protein